MACPKHHHHHADCNPITVIRSFKEVDFDQIDANTLVVFTKEIKLPESTINKLKARKIAMHMFTSQKNLKEIFSKTGCCLNKIVFFGDKENTVNAIAKTADDLGVAFTGYIYN